MKWNFIGLNLWQFDGHWSSGEKKGGSMGRISYSAIKIPFGTHVATSADRLGNFLEVYGVLHASNFPRHEQKSVWVEPLGEVCTVRCVYAPHYVAIWLGQISARPRCVFHFSSRAAWQSIHQSTSPSVCLTARLPACRVLTQLALRGPKQQLKTIANAETIAAARGLCKYLRF